MLEARGTYCLVITNSANIAAPTSRGIRASHGRAATNTEKRCSGFDCRSIEERQERAATNTEKECSSLPMASQKNASLSWIINAFKGWCTRSFGKKIFQPNYYEHIIWNETALDKIRKYIDNNPYKEIFDWNKIEGNVAAPSNGANR